MKKVLSLVLIFILLFSAIPMSYAADPTAGEQLKSMGLLVGDQYGNLNEGQYLTRTEMMVILARMLGEYDQAFAWSKTSNFVDGNNHWGERYVAYGRFKGWTAGIGNNLFGYERRHTVQEASVFMLKALGYTTPADFTWTTAYSKAKALGLFESQNLNETSDILRGNLFKVMLKTLYTKMNGQNFTLGEKLKVLEPEELPFEVLSVTSTNLKEIDIKFSREVDESTVSSSDFVITGRTVTPEILSDGITVRLTLSSALSDNTQYKITISGIRSEDNTGLTKVTVTFKTDDDEEPLVESVRLIGPNFVEITFNEPIKTAGTVQVYSGSTSYTSASAFEGLGTRTIIAELSKKPISDTSYTYKIRNFKDYAGYSNEPRDIKLAYKPAAFDPVASVKKATENYVLVEFSKVVSGLTKEHFYHTKLTNLPLGIFADAAMTDSISLGDEVKQVYIKFAERSGEEVLGYPLPAGSSTLYILEENPSDGLIIDEYGNAFMGGSYSLNVTLDRKAPSVTKLVVLSSSESRVRLTIEFDETVSFDEDNIEVNNSDDSIISGLTIDVSGSGGAYTATLAGANLVGRTVNVILQNVTDLAIIPNTLDEYEKSLSINDTIAPTVLEVRFDTVEMKIYILFSEAVGSTALSRYRYEINSSTLSTVPEFSTGNYEVVLSLTEAEYEKALKVGAKLEISGIKDLAGNTMSRFSILFGDI